MMATAAAVPGLWSDRTVELAAGGGVLLVLAAVAALLRGRRARRRARQLGEGSQAQAEPTAEAGPTAEAEQVAEAEPTAEAEQVAEVGPTAVRDETDADAEVGFDMTDWAHETIVLDEAPRRGHRNVRGSRRAWLRSAQDGREYLLAWKSTRIGRSADNDVVLSDPSVSRHHAVLHHADESWWLLPEVTGNGTFYNEQLVQPGERVQVGDGDALRFGLTPALRLSAPRPQDRPETLHFVSAARSTPGGERRGNEDVHLATDWVVAVADGVGGRNAGRVAARTAIQYVAQAQTTQSAAQSVEAAHAAILAQAGAEPPLRGMATTLDVARLRIVGDRVLVEGAHVGDGFVIVQDTSGTRLVTRPDTAGQRLAEVDPAGARRMENDPDFNRIVAALGFDGPLRQQTWTVAATVGQRLLLSSDGLLRAISCEDVIAIVSRHRDDPAEVLADHLLRLGIKSDDNVTVVVADIDVGPARHQPDLSQRGALPGAAAPGSSAARGDLIGTAEEG